MFSMSGLSQKDAGKCISYTDSSLRLQEDAVMASVHPLKPRAGEIRYLRQMSEWCILNVTLFLYGFYFYFFLPELNNCITPIVLS